MCLDINTLVIARRETTKQSHSEGTRLERLPRRYDGVAAKQGGYLMPMAIFILLVMGGMALTISRYTSQASAATIQEVMNVQAFYAAESGAQYAMNQLFYDEAQTMTQALALSNCSSLSNPDTFSGTGLHDCTATVGCESNNVSGVQYFTISSIGRCGTGTPFEAIRTLEVASFIE